MKKHIRFAISLVLLISVLAATFATALAAEARYTGVARLDSSLTISSTGAATCQGTATIYSGYTADVKVELKRDGTTIKTWKSSGGSGTVRAGGTYYVTSGHSYVVTTTVTVYDSNSDIVETPSKDSIKSSY